MNADGIMGLLFGTMELQGRQLLAESEKTDADKQECIRLIFKHGSGFEGGKVRILAATKLWARNEPKRFENFLKDEYSVGGCSTGTKWFMDYDSKGITFSAFEGEESRKIRFSWKNVGQLYFEEYLHGHLFPDLKTMQRMAEIQRTVGLPEPMPHLQYP